MRKGQNRKVKNVGRVSCLGLLALMLALANPVSSSGFAFAEEVPSDKTPEFIGEIEGGEVVDDEIVALADTPSTVEISFSPVAGSASLSPTTSAGQSAQVNVLATVNVQNSGGYSVYLKSSSVNLVGTKSSSNIIPGATTAKTYANMDANTWGYYAKEGTEVPDTATYKVVSVSGNGDKIAENTTKKITSDSKKIMLSFAAKINDQKPADTYKNTLTVSVVSSPVLLALSDISEMQQMTSDVCENTGSGATKQLKDTRDGKYYWVGKLADGKCWMTQNLDLDLSTDTKLTSDTSDVPVAGWTPDFNTATIASASTVNINSQTETRSWSLGNYRLTNPTESQSCGYPLADAVACPGPNATSGLDTNRFTAYTTPTTANGDVDAHYIIGNHYQWNAATAGTGNDITEGQATNSICPKGWKLPESNAATTGTFKGLIDAYNIGSDVAKLTDTPLHFVRGGAVSQDTSILFANAGYNGLYWSSTPYSNVTSAYFLDFWDTSDLYPSYSDARYGGFRRDGFSVRCVAR